MVELGFLQVTQAVEKKINAGGSTIRNGWQNSMSSSRGCILMLSLLR